MSQGSTKPAPTRVLVTGGAGYIGSHTAKALAKAGFEPVVYDNLSTGHRWAVKWGPLVGGDLADGQKLRETLEAYEIAAVIHFAASAYVGESMTRPREYFRNNVVGSLNLLDAMLEAGVKHVVFSSTCATYGVPEKVPISEDQPQWPINPYGESKLFVEKALKWYGEAYGLSSVALRYFNAAGADPEGELGEAHDPETHLIPLVIEAALGRRSHIDIFGSDYPTPDGTAVRDYIHVCDLANAHVQALRSLLRNKTSRNREVLNLGTGCGHSVREVLKTVELISGRSISIRIKPHRDGDPAALVADASRSHQQLEWKPNHSSLSAIVSSAWYWHERRPGAKVS